jgi:hypothetical protein
LIANGRDLAAGAHKRASLSLFKLELMDACIVLISAWRNPEVGKSAAGLSRIFLTIESPLLRTEKEEKMKSFRWMFIMVVCVLAAGGTQAQITIHQSDLDAIGFTTSISTTGTDVSLSTGAAGANQTWNFGDFPWAYTSVYQIMAPATVPHHESFPTATRAVIGLSSGTDVNSVSFERAAGNGLFMLGMVIADSATVLDQEQLLAPLPVTYQSTWTSVQRYHQELIPGYTMTITDSIVNHVDGWGTLITPYGNYACLRNFAHHYQSYAVTGVPPQTFEMVDYAWVNQHGEIIVSMSSPQDVTDPNFTDGTVQMMGAPLAVNPVRGPVATEFAIGQNYPNPFNPTTMLPMNLTRASHVALRIYDETGRLVSSEQMDLPVGHHDLAIDGRRWSSGLYFARVQASGMERTIKMQLLK